MKSHTYYDVLGVSRDATLEEITTAKNALAKVYHPDANVHKDIDTTAFMQEILEAYRVLSDPDKRKAYNQEVFGDTNRVFRTFTLGPENNEEEGVSFVTYWNTATRLHETGRSEKETASAHLPQDRKRPQTRRKPAQRADRTAFRAGDPVHHYIEDGRHSDGVLVARCNELGVDPMGTKTDDGFSYPVLKI